MARPVGDDTILGMNTPRIALTLGDPAGIGPEIVAGAWARPEVHAWCRPIAVGPAEVLRRAVALRRTGAKVVVIDAPDEVAPSPDVIPCLSCGPADACAVNPGAIDARAGQAAYEAVVLAARLALQGRIDALVTAPLHKEALHLAGYPYPGHTEILADLCGTREFAMMLYLGPGEPLGSPAGLAVVHVTLHTALRRAIDELSEDEVLIKLRLADRFMTRVQGARPRIGVCALNPHGGEGGLFGDEERRIIRPAVERGLAEGMNILGPLPTDTLMVRARDGEFEAVVAMYHDQGHIALKLLGMHRAVNVTLGLPIVRTSVAHGTAFDLAWQGRAEIGSMLEAIRVAARLAFAGDGGRPSAAKP
ncbi:MAG: 4-hydroxythreonine-4-phosphate dehydrogenase PdxA [Thermoguttaceae bacterium]|nr:4-hydroxythreonine-4-phosphate dehydrogenase PdxA [Thermoguttaceae bacterium]